MEPAFPSSPSRPPKYAIRVDVDRRLLIQTFYGTYAAKKFVEAVIAVHGDGATMRCAEAAIKTILAHRYTQEETHWQLPREMQRQIEALVPRD
jgi:hypothetical protein